MPGGSLSVVGGSAVEIVFSKFDGTDHMQLDGFERLRCLLDILYLIANSKERVPLASLGFKNTFNKDDAVRIDAVYNYLFQHFSEDISLGDVAHLINMNTSAFCKYTAPL